MGGSTPLSQRLACPPPVDICRFVGVVVGCSTLATSLAMRTPLPPPIDIDDDSTPLHELPDAPRSPVRMPHASSPVVLESPGGGATVGQLALNMIKVVVGFGVLTLPSGMERLSDNGMSSVEAKWLALLLLVIFAMLNSWTFVLIGEACERTGARTYTAAWHLTLGPRTAWLVTLSSIMICFNLSVMCQVAADALPHAHRVPKARPRPHPPAHESQPESPTAAPSPHPPGRDRAFVHRLAIFRDGHAGRAAATDVNPVRHRAARVAAALPDALAQAARRRVHVWHASRVRQRGSCTGEFG